MSNKKIDQKIDKINHERHPICLKTEPLFKRRLIYKLNVLKIVFCNYSSVFFFSHSQNLTLKYFLKTKEIEPKEC